MSQWDLTDSLEDYLEAILHLQEEGQVARVKDIADRISVKRSSVTIALRALSEKGLVNYSPYAVVTLTAQGFTIASCIRQRHEVLSNFFTEILEVDLSVADVAACAMEHGMRPPIFQRMQALYTIINEDADLKNRIRTEVALRATKSCGGNCHCRVEGEELPLLMDLNGCKTGDEGVIRRIVGSSLAKKRYLEMGMTVGQPVKVIKAAPLDDPIEIQVRNYRLSLRRGEAENILVEMLNG